MIWKNQYVLSRNKSIYNKEWIDKDIIFLANVLSDRGDPDSYDEFIQKKDLYVSQRDYNKIIQSISLKLLFILKNTLLFSPLSREMHKLLTGKNLCDRSCSNKHIRNTPTTYQSSYPKSTLTWKLNFPEIPTEKIWLNPNKFLVPNKIKKVHLKILHRYYPCNKFWHKLKPDISPVCSFFKKEIESVDHLFYEYIYSQEFWVKTALLIFSCTNKLVPILKDMVLFLNCNSGSKCVDDMIEFICLTGKYHIHKMKFLQTKPNINLFCVVLRYLFDSISRITSNKKAIKTSKILGKIIKNSN